MAELCICFLPFIPRCSVYHESFIGSKKSDKGDKGELVKLVKVWSSCLAQFIFDYFIKIEDKLNHVLYISFVCMYLPIYNQAREETQVLFFLQIR